MVIILNSQVFQTTHTAQSYTRLHLNKHYLEKNVVKIGIQLKWVIFYFVVGYYKK